MVSCHPIYPWTNLKSSFPSFFSSTCISNFLFMQFSRYPVYSVSRSNYWMHSSAFRITNLIFIAEIYTPLYQWARQNFDGQVNHEDICTLGLPSGTLSLPLDFS
jgi:hypothetical protein